MSQPDKDLRGLAAIGVVIVAGIVAVGLIVVAVFAVRADVMVAVEAIAALSALGAVSAGAIATYLGAAVSRAYSAVFEEPENKEEARDQ